MHRRSVVLISLFVLFFFAAALAGCSQPEKRRGAGETVDDSWITTKVKAGIVNDELLKGFNINVTTFGGIVELSGFVDTQQQADRAVQVARGVEGVKSVKNALMVKQAQPKK